MARTSDDTTRERLSVAQQITALDEASKRAEKTLADLKARTRKPHLCHVCGTETSEDES